MERKFYPENFEKYLKGHTDQFKITPSKKVWQGIYNDMHPGTRWPSITISLVFIFALVIIGHLNSNNNYKNVLYNLNNLSAFNIKPTAPSKSNNKNRAYLLPLKNYKETNTNIQDNEQSFEKNTSANANLNSNVTEDNNFKSPSNSTGKVAYISSDKKENNTYTTAENSTDNIQNGEANIKPSVANADPKLNSSIRNNVISNTTSADNNISKSSKVRKNPAIFSYYISPSFSYRSFSDSKMNTAVNHKPMAGYEAGIALSTRLIKQLRFTTGLQFNYSGYHIKASSTHPIQANLILNTDFPGQFNTYSAVSTYGNGIGNENTRLKNYSFQLSAPTGFQYSFGGEDKDKFVIEATLQPTYIMASNAYLLSTDKKNYLNDPFLFRRWNMNTGFSTSVSIKSNSFNWQIGPQIRYQLLSTYSKSYPVKEHLINYGIRIGISKISK